MCGYVCMLQKKTNYFGPIWIIMEKVDNYTYVLPVKICVRKRRNRQIEKISHNDKWNPVIGVVLVLIVIGKITKKAGSRQINEWLEEVECIGPFWTSNGFS